MSCGKWTVGLHTVRGFVDLLRAGRLLRGVGSLLGGLFG